MSTSRTYTVPYNRKKQGRTNYKKRLEYLKSHRPRIVIRSSNNNLMIQAVKYELDGDKVMSTIKATDLKEYGWQYATGNLSAAYLTGLLFAKKNKIKDGIVDLGLHSITKGARLAATIKGLKDGGLEINYDDKIDPSEDKISGKTTADYAHKLSKDDEEMYNKQFSKYLKNKVKPEDIVKNFSQVKTKILGEK
nr:50S ribosomal protein L18 [Nanoarchaeum sp.]